MTMSPTIVGFPVRLHFCSFFSRRRCSLPLFRKSILGWAVNNLLLVLLLLGSVKGTGRNVEIRSCLDTYRCDAACAMDRPYV